MNEAWAWIPWSIMVLGMFMVWGLVYSKTGDFRKSTIGSLLVAKTFAVVYKLAGLDRTILKFYLIGRDGTIRELHVTMIEVLLLLLFTSLLATIYYPVVTRHMPKELKETLEQ